MILKFQINFFTETTLARRRVGSLCILAVYLESNILGLRLPLQLCLRVQLQYGSLLYRGLRKTYVNKKCLIFYSLENFLKFLERKRERERERESERMRERERGRGRERKRLREK